jgi:hypothetical protein
VRRPRYLARQQGKAKPSEPRFPPWTQTKAYTSDSDRARADRSCQRIGSGTAAPLVCGSGTAAPLVCRSAVAFGVAVSNAHRVRSNQFNGFIAAHVLGSAVHFEIHDEGEEQHQGNHAPKPVPATMTVAVGRAGPREGASTAVSERRAAPREWGSRRGTAATDMCCKAQSPSPCTFDRGTE